MPHYADLSSYTPEELAFWDRFAACAGHTFTTARGLAFTFAIRGNEVFFDRKEKSITRSSIMQGYRKARELTAAGSPIDGPKKLGVFGASYLFPVFAHLGALDPTPANTPPTPPPRGQLTLF